MAEREPVFTNASLAEVVAYAEKPYQDELVKNPEQVDSNHLSELANQAGAAAARAYISEQNVAVDTYTTLYGVEPEAEDKGAVLNESFLDAYTIYCRQNDKPTNARVLTMLKQNGISTVRHILMYGRDGIKDIYKVGDKTAREIEAAIDVIAPDQPFPLRTSYEHIISLADNLDQVPYLIISPASSYYALSIVRGMSVGDILSLSAEELVKRLRVPSEEYQYTLRAAERMLDKAGRFKELFEAKTRSD